MLPSQNAALPQKKAALMRVSFFLTMLARKRQKRMAATTSWKIGSNDMGAAKPFLPSNVKATD